MVVGSPSVWPRSWARWLPPNRVKSGMFRARVDQKPIMPIRAGKNTFQKSDPQPRREGWARIGPKPPARTTMKPKRVKAATMTSGAAQFSKRRTASMPR